MKHTALHLMVAIALFLTVVAIAQEKPASTAERYGFLSRNNDQPLHITADRFTVNNKTKISQFIGNVTAIQGDATLTADLLEIEYGEGDGSEQVKRITATGELVEIIQQAEKRRAICKKAVYIGPRDIVVLTGDPEVWQDQDHMSGTRIELHMGTEQVRVEGAPDKKVQVTLFPDGEAWKKEEGSKKKGVDEPSGSKEPDQGL